MQPIDAWLSYLQSHAIIPSHQALSRIDYLYQSLELIRLAPLVIVVVGTNGKGSVVRMLESIYMAAGYRVAAVTSPHLLEFNERLRIQGQSVSTEQLLAGFEAMESARDPQRPFNLYDVFTAAIYHTIKAVQPEVAIIEAGLGGRLDVVNLLDRDAVVLTTVDLDHQAILGNDREAIGYEKAAVFRAGIPLVSGEMNPPQSVLDKVHEVSGHYFQLNKHFSYELQDDSWFFEGAYEMWSRLPRPQLKEQNVAAVLQMIQCLSSQWPVSLSSIQQSLQATSLSGRFELVQEDPIMVLDVAHNAQSAQWLAEQCGQWRGKAVTAIVGCLQGKSIGDIVSPMLPIVTEWLCVSLPGERGRNCQEIAEVCWALGAKTCYNFTSVSDAMDYAMQAQTPRIVVVYGSFYTVAAAKQFLRETNS